MIADITPEHDSKLNELKGVIDENEFTINKPIGRSPNQPQKMGVYENGKESISEVKVLKRFKDASLIEVHLITGRTHQIRVHLSSIGHPVYNDTLYGFGKMKIKTEEQVLQSYKLSFPKPFGGETLTFELEPDETEAYLKYIQTYIDSENEISENGSKQLDINQGLGIIANRIKSGSGGIDKNDAVLYKLALTYFDELGDYKTAIKYLSMVDKTDEEYGKLADYYNSVATMLATTNVDASGLIDSINSFAEYNSKSYTNQNVEKFFNYKIKRRN